MGNIDARNSYRTSNVYRSGTQGTYLLRQSIFMSGAKRISERNMGDNAPRLECKPVHAITEIWKEDGKKHIIKIIDD